MTGRLGKRPFASRADIAVFLRYSSIVKKLVVTVAFLGGLVAAYLYAYPIYTFRYRVTVEAEVEGIVRSGESVVEARWVTMPPFVPLDVSRDYSVDLHGEAVFVDLGLTHLPLMLTLSASAAQEDCRTCTSFVYLPLRAYQSTQDREDLSALSKKMKSRVEVDRVYWPGLVTFESGPGADLPALCSSAEGGQGALRYRRSSARHHHRGDRCACHAAA